MELFDQEGNPIDVYDADGNKVEETLVPEEVDQRISEAKEEVQASLQKDLEEAKNQAQEKEDLLKAKEEELAKLSNKDTNFKKLKEGKEEEIALLKKEMEEIKGQFSGLTKEAKEKEINNTIDNLTEGDEEMAKKVKFYYGSFAIPEEDNAEKQSERIKNALILAGGASKANALKGVIGSGAGEGILPKMDLNPGGEKLSSDAVGLAHKLGIDDKDLKKHKLT